MVGARQRAGSALTRTVLLGGSFNPAHRGHRRVSLWAAKALAADDVWWMVSPGNPLKAGAKDMASLNARLRSARRAARLSPIRATAIEAELGTRYTVDTLAALVRRYPKRRFIWLMGADNLAQFHRWRDWRKIARMMPIAVIARPGYDDGARAAVAMGWFRRFVRPRGHANQWTTWRPPALVLLRFRPDPTSATALRRAAPDWARGYPPNPVRDMVTRRIIE
jgi:nicotinate-nucleotide adenylyltransferase